MIRKKLIFSKRNIVMGKLVVSIVCAMKFRGGSRITNTFVPLEGMNKIIRIDDGVVELDRYGRAIVSDIRQFNQTGLDMSNGGTSSWRIDPKFVGFIMSKQ